ncbi:MAG: hypothetical protein NXH75_01490 [Halobacteriovoraceae bacterium]|nr:hypothetical protein [Halobacteriovoraceae bacterium]
MILPVSALAMLSIAWGFSPWRFQRYGYLFTNIVSGLVACGALLSWSGGLDLGYENSFLVFAFGLEIFAFYFLVGRDQKISLLPYYSIPLIQLAFLTIIITNPMTDYFVLYVLGAILIDFIIGASEKRTRENIGKTLIMIVSLVTLILLTHLDSTKLSLPILAFIYWTTQKCFPLGLGKSDKQAVQYSVTGRTTLFILATNALPLALASSTIFQIVLGIGSLSLIFFFLLEDEFKAWSLIKQTNEVILILLSFLVWGVFGKAGLLLIIMFNLYYFLPLILTYIEIKGPVTRVLHVIPFLLINGIFFGAISKFSNSILKDSEFMHFGLDIFYVFGTFWLLNIAFACRFPNLRMVKRKIDHFHPLLLASVIITALVISF